MWRLVRSVLGIALCVWGVHAEDDDEAYEAPVPGSYALPALKRAADGDVLDTSGRELKLSELTRGRVTVLSFIYTRCAASKACPYATGVLNAVQRATQDDAGLRKGVRLISMSFDPQNDTPARLADWSSSVRSRTNSADWYFLTTSSEQKLNPILEGYGQRVDRRANPFDPAGPLSHVLRVYLMDAEGMVRNIYSSATLDPRLVLADIRTLLLEKAASK